MREKIFSCIALLTVFFTLTAADFPQKPITLLVPVAAGGGTDTITRAFANLLQQNLGKPVVVVNKVGGGGAIGMTEGASAKPDGYTITVVIRELASLYQMNLSQVTPDSFDLLALLNEDPAVLVVKAGSRFSSVKDLVAAAKNSSARIKYASPARPSYYLLALENNQQVKFHQIPYNGAVEAMPAVLGGHVDFSMMGPGEVIAQVNSQKLVALGVCAEQRIEAMPAVPTMKEQGINVISHAWRGLALPKGTPESVRKILLDAIAKSVSDPKFVSFMKERFFGLKYLPAGEFQSYVAQDVIDLKKLINQSTQ